VLRKASGRATAGSSDPLVAVLTGGGDRPYALGLAATLIAQGVTFDFIGSDDLDAPELRTSPHVRFLNFRGDQRVDAPLAAKVFRIAIYYARLLQYAAVARPRVFHILWNNKIELLDRTLLLLYYKLLGKHLALTVHNVNAGERDGDDSRINRWTLWFQYWIADHLFVHTARMKESLCTEFGVVSGKISVIPLGINSTVPDTALSRDEARQRLGLSVTEKVVLFYGNIAAYKGLEYLVEAMALVGRCVPECRLIIAGRPKGHESYWRSTRLLIEELKLDAIVIQRIEYIPDDDTEAYFKAADVLVLPYTHVYQSGVLFLGYNFGLPVIATDVGSLRDDVIEGRTGFICRPKDPAALAASLKCFFSSVLHRDATRCRDWIRQWASERYSWSKVGHITNAAYRTVLRGSASRGVHAPR
jgi:glycosyltransferase involved in cell wall biosynthesis